MSARIGKWGNSAAIRIPAATLEAAGLALGEEVELLARQGRLELRALRGVPSIEALFAKAEKKYGTVTAPGIIPWGPDAGAEVVADDWSDIAPSDAEMGIGSGGNRRPRSRRR
jgi:antitoxin component of MazEF toxin-antitoxin module